MRNRYHRRHPISGLIIGTISGLAATAVMTQFQNVWNKLSKEKRKPKNGANPAEEEKEDSTMKAAGKMSEKIGYPLSREARKKAGPWVHYGFGASVGAAFGLAAEVAPDSVRRTNPLFAGAAYGTLVFLAAHEVVVPSLKLSSNPLKEPIPEQIAEFISHLVYGIGTAVVYDGVNRLKR